MKKLCFFRGQRPFKHATIGAVLPAVSHWRDILFGIRRFFMLENVFHLKENHTDVKTEIMAGITTFMNQIRDISVPEKMWCHIEIQCIVDALVRSASLTKLR